jgi:hypothetical protein
MKTNKQNENHIVILGQSLKNDGTGDVWIDGQFIHNTSDSNSIDIKEFLKRLTSGMSNSKQLNNDIRYCVIKEFLDRFFLFEVNGNERDNKGRIAPICIQIPKKEISAFEEAFNQFLNESGRTVSPENRKAIRKILDGEKNRSNKIVTCITIGIIAGAIIGGCIDNHKSRGIGLGAVLGAGLGSIAGATINKNQLKK